MEVMPTALALVAAAAIMLALAFAIERLVLRPLVNQEGVALLMATLGVTYFLDGFGQTLWGSDIYKIDLGIAKEPVMILDSVFKGGILVNKEDFVAAIVAAAAQATAAGAGPRRGGDNTVGSAASRVAKRAAKPGMIALEPRSASPIMW